MKLNERFNKLRFNWAIRAIAGTPPVARGDGPFTVLSMVQHRDVLPYLLALKSFARFAPPAAVVLVADPTLDANDRALIRDHVPHISFREAADMRRPGIPKGGCWERLSAIAEHSAGAYVVQLDADTVAVAPPADVTRAIADGVSFTLGTEDEQFIDSTAAIALWAQGRLDGNDHIQGLAEACLDRLDPEGRYRYVRGCAGFAGFAQGSIDPAAVLEVSQRMGALMGDQWSAWGTEQFTSNLLVASSPGARVLPHPTYCAPHRRTAATVFFHFIGYVRYASGLYASVAGDVARELRRAEPPSPRHAA